jgi:hypothetical protein
LLRFCSRISVVISLILESSCIFMSSILSLSQFKPISRTTEKKHLIESLSSAWKCLRLSHNRISQETLVQQCSSFGT